MLSIAARTCLICTERTSTWDKAAYVRNSLSNIDMAIGIIAQVIGWLAIMGVLPMSGGGWIMGGGLAYFILAASIRCQPQCSVIMGHIKETQREPGDFGERFDRIKERFS